MSRLGGRAGREGSRRAGLGGRRGGGAVGHEDWVVSGAGAGRQQGQARRGGRRWAGAVWAGAAEPAVDGDAAAAPRTPGRRRCSTIRVTITRRISTFRGVGEVCATTCGSPAPSAGSAPARIWSASSATIAKKRPADPAMTGNGPGFLIGSRYAPAAEASRWAQRGRTAAVRPPTGRAAWAQSSSPPRPRPRPRPESSSPPRPRPCPESSPPLWWPASSSPPPWWPESSPPPWWPESSTPPR